MKEGHEVRGFDSDLYAGCTYGPAFPDFPFTRKDIRDVELSDLEGYDAVIHLAALSNDPLSDLNPHLTFEINHAASVKLASLAKEAGVKRFLFSSSCSTYGASGDNILNEEASFNPVTPYGTTKVLVERDVSALADDTFSPTFLRNATAYGVSPRMRFDLVLNNLVAWAYASGLVYLKSDGTPWRPVVHVEDISRAFLTILHAPREIGSQPGVQYRQQRGELPDPAIWPKIVEKTVPGCRIEFAKDAGPDKRCYRVDFGKFDCTFPGYELQMGCQVRSASRSIESYRKIRHPPGRFRGAAVQADRSYQETAFLGSVGRNPPLDGTMDAGIR